MVTPPRRPNRTGAPPGFTGVHLHWRVQRWNRTFRVGVVEPDTYSPGLHAEIFYKVVSDVLSPGEARVETLDPHALSLSAERFDLVTFPEAFVPATALLQVVRTIRAGGPSGCFHAGLRPTQEGDRHLFRCPELEVLLDALESVADVPSDLSAFRDWLTRQPVHHMFNVGAVFAVDAEGQTRICLHPKIVKARVEFSARSEEHMAEADLLTLITLWPSDEELLTVTMQPLLCSDALDLETDRPTGGPLRAISRFARCFEQGAPDHVDIVSVPTCTPQRRSSREDGRAFHEWPEQFRRSFEDASVGTNLPRHHFSAFVLSNFRMLDDSRPGGLSGVFLPIPPVESSLHPDVLTSCFGRLKHTDASNDWSRPDDDALVRWDNRGYVAGLDPAAGPSDAVVRMFAFTINRLPRTHSFWSKTDGLAKCVTQAWRRDGAGELVMEVRG